MTLTSFDSSSVLYVIYALNKLDISFGCAVSTGSDDTLLRPFSCKVERDASKDFLKIKSEFTIASSLSIKIHYFIKNEATSIFFFFFFLIFLVFAPTLKYVKNYVSDTRYEEVSSVVSTKAEAMAATTGK